MTEINHTDNLPIEVLEYIMSFLDPKTRKIARLVSKNWCQACRGFKKLVISDVYADWTDRIFDTVTDSDNRFEEIEFHCVDLVNHQCSTFWDRCGHHIKSLHFYDARISPKIFVNIIEKSPRLTHISMHWSLKKRHFASFDEIVCVLDDLIQRNLKNNSVISLDISVPCYSSVQFFERMFNVFPNIKTLKIFYWDRMSEEDELFIIRQAINWKEQLEVLSLRSFADPGFEWNTLLLRTDLIRLKEVHLNMTVNSSNEHLTQFISKLSNLEHLNVEICGYGLVEGSNALLDFIFTHKSCQNLKVLRFTGPVRVMWRRAFFDLLCKSSLRKLLLDCTHIDFIGSENLPITKNNNLKVLQLSERFPESRQHYNSLMILFIRACSGLEKLELAAVTCEIMDAVNQYQSGLRVFRTSHDSYCGFPLNEIEPSVCNLSNLTDLEELSIFTSNWDFANRFLHCFRPHLRYLYVEESINIASVFKLLPNVPLLETLIVKLDTDDFLGSQEVFTYILQSMKNLKYIWICIPTAWQEDASFSFFRNSEKFQNPPDPCNEFAKQIFKACPSLRIFIFGPHLYNYNVIEKCMNLRESAFVSGANLINNSLNFKNNFLQERTSPE